MKKARLVGKTETSDGIVTRFYWDTTWRVHLYVINIRNPALVKDERIEEVRTKAVEVCVKLDKKHNA